MKKKKGLLIAVIVFFLGLIGFTVYLVNNRLKDTTPEKVVKNSKQYNSAYRMDGNKLDNFDLYFLQIENNKKNKVYSPLSIKYALAMLEKGTEGDSNGQINAVIGDYHSKKYINSNNLSLANAVFIRDTLSNNVRNSYINTVKDKYDAEIIYDSFQNANKVNSWVSNKTFKLIENILSDDEIKSHEFELINALAIDMEWNKKIQADNYKESFSVNFKHENYFHYIPSLDMSPIKTIKFDNESTSAKVLEVGVTANRYDIVKELGEQKIKNTVKEELEKYKSKNGNDCLTDDQINNVDKYLNEYVKEIDSNYDRLNISTDFYFNDTENEKVFAKDLKEYDGTTLQYIGIMPKNKSLAEYISDSDAKSINKVISNMKDLSKNSFKDGVITQLIGEIPIFNYDYKLSLKDDLQNIGITDVFDSKKADLSGMLTKSEGYYIGSASHKANIDFSNEGIKAAAVTQLGGVGSASCGFDYAFDVPVENIDLSFNNPYMFIIRDKDSGEVWFMGTVYQPTK